MPGGAGMTFLKWWKKKQKQKQKTCRPWIPRMAKLSLKNEGENKRFPDKQKVREFVTRPARRNAKRSHLNWNEARQ